MAQLTLADVRVIDADTFRTHGVDYRLYGVDAPETGGRAHCAAERALGERAAARVAELFARASSIVAIPARDPPGRRRWPRDGFGRRLAHIAIDGVSLARSLVEEGLAVPWTPSQPTPDWC